MVDGAPSEFLLSPSPTGGGDAREALIGLLQGDTAVLLDRATHLIDELSASLEDLHAITEDGRISVKVLPTGGSVRVEIRDHGTGAVLGGLRRLRGPVLAGMESSPPQQGRRSLGAGVERGRCVDLVRARSPDPLGRAHDHDAIGGPAGDMPEHVRPRSVSERARVERLDGEDGVCRRRLELDPRPVVPTPLHVPGRGWLHEPGRPTVRVMESPKVIEVSLTAGRIRSAPSMEAWISQW